MLVGARAPSAVRCTVRARLPNGDAGLQTSGRLPRGYACADDEQLLEEGETAAGGTVRRRRDVRRGGSVDAARCTGRRRRRVAPSHLRGICTIMIDATPRARRLRRPVLLQSSDSGSADGQHDDRAA